MKKFNLICLLAAMLLPAAANAQTPVPWVQTFNESVINQPCSIHGLTIVNGFGFECMTNEQSFCDGSIALKFSLWQNVTVVALPTFSTPIDSLALSFYTYPDDYLTGGTLEVGYVTSILDSTTFHPIATYHAYDSDFYGGCIEKQVTFAGAPEGSIIAFRHSGLIMTSNWWVDNIQVYVPSACNAPTISVSNTTQNSAEISLLSDGNASSYIIYLNDQLVDTIYSDLYTFTNLASNTSYNVMAYSICDTSAGGRAVFMSFTTECGYDAPYYEDFNSYDYMSSPRCFQAISYSSLPPRMNFGPLNMVLFVDKDVLFPPVAIPDSIVTYQDLQISFSYANWGDVALNNDSAKTEVGFFTDRYNPTSWVTLLTIDSSNGFVFDGMMHDYDIYLSANAYPDTINLTFRNYGNVDSILIDNVYIGPARDCRRPTYGWIDSTTSEAVYLRWSPYNDGMAHQYQISASNLFYPGTFIQPWGDLVFSTFPDTTLSVTGLPPSTHYYFWVRTLCSDTSDWLYIGSTTVPCPTGYDAPYYNDFSNTTANSEPYCWNILQRPSYGGWPEVENSTLKLYNNAISDTNLIVMPYVRLQANNMMVTATAWIDPMAPIFEIGYMTNPDSINSFVPLDTIMATSPTEYDIITSSVSPTIDSIWIAFRTHAHRTGGYINDVLVREIPNCIRPSELHLDTVGHSFADFTIYGSSATLFEVRYASVNNLDSAESISVSGNTFSLNTLTPMVTYYTWVRSICGTDTSDWRTGPSFTTKCGEDACPIYFTLNDFYLISLSNGAGLNVYSDTSLIHFIGCPGEERQIYEETMWVCPDMAPLKFQLTYSSFIFWFDITITQADSTVYTFDCTTYNNGDTLLTLSAPCPTCPPVQTIQIDTTTTTSINLSWTPADSTDNSWIVYLDNVPVDTVSTTSYSFTDLNSNTGYTLGVATNCSGTPATIQTIDTFTVCALYEPCPINVFIIDEHGGGALFNNAVQVWSNNYMLTSVSSHSTTPITIAEDVYVCSGDSVILRWVGTGFIFSDSVFDVGVRDATGHLICSGSAEQYILDPVICSFLPDCPCLAPDTITNTATTQSITVTWSNSDSTEVTISQSEYYTNGYTVNTNTGSVTFDGLTHNTVYYIRLRSFCRYTQTFSEWGEVQDTTLYDSTIVIPDLPCPAPDSLELLGTTYTTASIQWTAGGNETQWEVEFSHQGDISYRVTSETSMVFDSLWPEIIYTVRVRAICGQGYEEGLWSNPLTFSTDVCPPVSTFAVSDTAVNGATVTWTQVPSSVGYKLLWGLPDFYDAEASTILVPSNANQYAIDGLQPETAYEVSIINMCTETIFSAPSQRIGFTTLPEVGILTVDGNTLILSPNPASDKVNISINANWDAFDVEVIDMNGVTVISENVVGDKSTIDVSHLSQGTYIVRITNYDWTAVRKLIVK